MKEWLICKIYGGFVADISIEHAAAKNTKVKKKAKDQDHERMYYGIAKKLQPGTVLDFRTHRR